MRLLRVGGHYYSLDQLIEAEPDPKAGGMTLRFAGIKPVKIDSDQAARFVAAVSGLEVIDLGDRPPRRPKAGGTEV